MKKLALIVSFLMLVPGAAFGLEMMNDASMDDVTGQAGVSIAFDDVQIFMNIERLAWMDTDGFSTAENYGGTGLSGAAGAVGLQNFQLDVLNVNAITNTGGDGDNDYPFASTTGGDIELFFEYGSTTALGGAQLATKYTGGDEGGTVGLDNFQENGNLYRALSIDATSQLPAISEGKKNNTSNPAYNVGGVLIGLPTMEIYIDRMKLTPAFYDVEGNAAGSGDAAAFNDYITSSSIAAAATGDTDHATYGTIVMDGVTFTTLSGWMEIAPH